MIENSNHLIADAVKAYLEGTLVNQTCRTSKLLAANPDFSIEEEIFFKKTA
ncbi:MAG TPA: hypothetical protein VKA08_10855 [Balneolales bacterium]|nr:hypothetical protein [Balneolales bacterium]